MMEPVSQQFEDTQQRMVAEKSRKRLNHLAGSLRLSRLQGRLIIPYVLLTLMLAMIGIYVVTRLVSSSIRERFYNQLYEASRVSADGIVRQENFHLDQLRLMAFTQGVAQAFSDKDADSLQELLLPLAMNNQVQIVSAIDLDGRELITLGLDPTSGQYITARGGDFSAYPLVQNPLQNYVDEFGDKFVGILETDQGLVLTTSTPVRDESDQLVGVLLIGTRLDDFVNQIKSQALTDIVILDENYNLMATTLAEPESIYEEIVQAADNLTNQGPESTIDTVGIELYERDFQIYYAPLVVRNTPMGWLGVLLPSNYVTTTEATNRDVFVVIFAVSTIAVAILGYLLAQSIARPILRLRSMSQAVAAGDLDQNISLQRRDEIGELADAFDQMTLNLRARTEEAARLYSETVQRNKELAEINERLQATQLQLIQSEKLAAIGQLTAGIIHDVKNPIGAIKGLAQLTQEEDDLSPETREAVDMIYEGAVKAETIVTDLLKFARQSELEMKPQDLRETVNSALRLTDYLIRKGSVKLITDLPEQPVIVTCDAQQIEQVIVNMIDNAVHAMPAGGTLRINLSQADGVAGVAIQDTGKGIDPENLRRVFDPFFTTKPAGEGTGLGLSVSYGIISSHNGRIDVESEVGKGTTFTILLPEDQPEPQEN
jgi:two-component system NtrC family sensor kinase